FIDLLIDALPELTSATPGYLHTEKCLNLRNVISISDSGYIYDGCFNYEDILRSGIRYTSREIDQLIEQIKPEDHSYILYTYENSIMLGQLPFYHVAGCVYITLGTAIRGATVVMMEYFDPTEALRLIEEEKITTLGGFDTHFQYLLSHPLFPETDVSSVKKII